MTGNYILVEKDGKKVAIPENDLIAWAQWFGANDRTVAKDDYREYHLSTVFLGIDHSFLGDDAPVLYETMLFGSEDSSERYCERYTTWEEAEAGHKRILKELKNGTLVGYGEE